MSQSTTIQPRQPEGIPSGGQFAAKDHAGDDIDLLNESAAEPTAKSKLGKKFLRQALPFREADLPIFGFERDGKQWWTNRFVMCPVAGTIDPYIADGELDMSGASTVALRGKGSKIDYDGEHRGPSVSTTEQILDRWDTIYVEDDRDFAQFSTDDGNFADASYVLDYVDKKNPDSVVGLARPDGTRVWLSTKQLALATGEDTTGAREGIRLHQALRPDWRRSKLPGSDKDPATEPVVITRNGRFAGLIMPRRQPVTGPAPQ